MLVCIIPVFVVVVFSGSHTNIIIISNLVLALLVVVVAVLV